MKTATLPASTQPEARPIGITLPCPCCGNAESEINLRLWDGTFQCTDCDGEFDADLIRRILATWPKVLAWLDTMPSND